MSSMFATAWALPPCIIAFLRLGAGPNCAVNTEIQAPYSPSERDSLAGVFAPTT